MLNAHASARPLALVTGASRGIGLAVAQRLAREGHDLVVIANDHTRIEAVAKELRSADPMTDVRVIGLDLAQRGAADQVVRVLRERRLEVDVLCCHAGVGAPDEWEQAIDPHAELDMIPTTVEALVELAKHVVKGMVARGRGHVVFTAPVVDAPSPSRSVYGATREFLFSFAETLREELNDTGVVVTTLSPSPADTSFVACPGMTGMNDNKAKRDRES